MEVNKDEAERCIEIALGALESAQPERARRFLEKAQRLFPTRRTQGERTEAGLMQALYLSVRAYVKRVIAVRLCM